MIEFDKTFFTPKSQVKPSLFKPSNKFTLFEAMLEVYYSTSDLKDFQPVRIPPPVSEWARQVYQDNGADPTLVEDYGTLHNPNIKEDKDTIFHFVTAGKDSTATALKHEGQFKHSKLIHVVGVNKIYPTEHRMAKAVYEDKSLFPDSEYHALKVRLPRVTNGSESPIKNMFIISLAIEYFKTVPKWSTLGGSATIADISETEVYGDTSAGLVPFLAMLNKAFSTPTSMDFTPYLRDQVEAYEVILNHGITYDRVASCMSQMRFKGMQRKMATDKYTVQIEGNTLLSGTVQASGTSIFTLTKEELANLKLSDLINTDIILDDDYRCIQGCFKCREKALVHTKHMNAHFHPEYIKSCKKGIISWMDKSPNNNKINLEAYLDYVLGIPLSEIPTKYHGYIKGESLRPEGWKPPKPTKKKKVKEKV